MRIHWTSLMIFLVGIHFDSFAAPSEIPDDPQLALRWQESRMTQLENFKKLPRNEMIEGIGRMVRQLNRLNYRECSERDYIELQAQTALATTPGHAEYYRDKVDLANDVRKAAIPNAGDNNVGAIDHGVKLLKFMDARQEAFQVLRNLPSPETVRVLGHYLEDEWVSPLPFGKPHWFEQPLASHAAEALEGLPIVNKPVNRIRPDRGEPEKDLRAWQQWHEQIKSGKRTFRFEGDPTEYDLNGPAPNEKLVRIERDRKRDEERANHSSKNSSVQTGGLERFTSSPGSTAGVIASVLGILAAGWYFWRKKTQHA